MAAPRSNPPGRNSIRQLALREPVLFHSLELFDQGRVTYEGAMHLALVAICDQNAVLNARLSEQERERLDRMRLGLPVGPPAAVPNTAARNVH